MNIDGARWIVALIVLLTLMSSAIPLSITEFNLKKEEFSGVILSAENVPIAGAKVEAVGKYGYGYAVTDEQGRYRIDKGLATGYYNVTVTAKGYLKTVKVNVYVKEGEETKDVNFVLELSGVIKGVVRSAATGKPIVNATVIAISEDGKYSDTTFTDSEGRYTLNTNLGAGVYTVGVVYARGHISMNKTGIRLEARGTATVDFDLKVSGVINGYVKDKSTGQPVAGAMVVATSSDMKHYGYAMTDSNGYYEISTGLDTGTYNVTVMMAEGYVIPATKSGVEVKAGEVTKDVNFSLEKSGRIVGRVVDQEGKPVKGASVFAMSTDRKYYGYAMTDEEGRYEITSGLGTGTYTVSAMKMGYQAIPQTNVKVIAGETTTVNFQLIKLPSGILKGYVKDATTGKPIKNATVRVISLMGVPTATAQTDENGYYEISAGLLTGTYNVTAEAPGYSPETKTVRVEIGKVTTLNFNLEELISGIITGLVLGPVTKKSSSISVQVSPTEAEIGGEVTISGQITPARVGIVSVFIMPEGGRWIKVGEVKSGTDGKFTFKLKTRRIGKHYVKVSWPGDEEYAGAESPTPYPSFIVTKKSTSLTLTLSSTKIEKGKSITISGQLKPPLANIAIKIDITKPDGSVSTYTAKTNVNGKFTLTITPDRKGTYKVVAHWAGDKIHKGCKSNVVTFTVEEKKCIIATVTFGSELAPEVQTLREFRSSKVYSTFAGSQFMEVFNAWYYSFSTDVANFLERNEPLKLVTKALIYPLIKILKASSAVYETFSTNPEVAIVVTGFVVSWLIGLVYFAPLTLLLLLPFKRYVRKCVPTLLKALVVVWLLSLVIIGVSEISHAALLMMMATATFVLSTIALSVTSTIALMFRLERSS